MEEGRAQQLIGTLKEILENGQTVPFSNSKVMIPKEEAEKLLDELSYVFNVEIKKYREVVDKRGKILNDAKSQAADIVLEANEEVSRIRKSYAQKNILTVKAEELDEDKRQNLYEADDMYAASIIYSQEMLTEVDEIVNDAYASLKQEYNAALKALKEKKRIISSNKEELTSRLGSLSKEERYSRIVEISEVISNEIYYGNKEVKNTKQIESMQLELEFDK